MEHLQQIKEIQEQNKIIWTFNLFAFIELIIVGIYIILFMQFIRQSKKTIAKIENYYDKK